MGRKINFTHGHPFKPLPAGADPAAPLGYAKRAAAYLHQRKSKEAMRDLDRALEVDPAFVQGYLSRGRLLRQSCQFEAARRDFGSVLALRAGNAGAQKELTIVEETERALAKARALLEAGGDTPAVEAQLDRVVLAHAPDCREARMMKAELMLAAGDYSGVVAETASALKADENDLAALLLRGRGYFYLGDHEHALKHYQMGLRSDPEHGALKKEYRKLKNLEKKTKAAEEALAKSKLRVAIEDFTAALQIDPDHRLHNVRLYLGLCKATGRLGRNKDCVAACSSALEIDGELLEALVKRAEARLALEEFDAAVADFRAAREKSPQDGEIAQGLQNAEKALKLSKRRDWYKVLGIERSASIAEIKRAYKKLALLYHPDKNVGNEEETDKKFRDVAEAYEVLGDEDKRTRYDRGEDLDEQQQGGGPGGPFGGGQQFHFTFEGGFPGGGFPGGGFQGFG
eukprot:jgi/Mesen1/5669/ME000288S04880